MKNEGYTQNLAGEGGGANKVHYGKCGGVYTFIFLEIFSKLLF